MTTDPKSRRLRPWGLAVVAATILAAVVGYSRWRRPQIVPKLGTETATIVPGVHMIRGLGPSVAYVVETSVGPVLIDAGLEADASTLKAEMAKLLIDWRGIKAILLTHVHGDHVGGAEAIRRATGAKIHAGRGDADVIRAGGPREAFFSAFYMPNHSPHATTVDVELDGDRDLTFGDTRIRAIAAPGHTPGSVCYLLERGGHRLFFSGDVIMHLSEEKPLGTYSAYLAPKHRGDAKTSLDTIVKLRALKAPDIVLPGHPPLGANPNAATMTADRWSAIMDQGASDMETLLARYAADGPDFLDGELKPLLTGVYYLGDAGGVSGYAFVDGARLVLVDAPDSAEATAAKLSKLGASPASPAVVLLTSGDPAHRSGLRSIVERWRCRVVVAPSCIGEVRNGCPAGAEIVSSEEFAKLGIADCAAVPLKPASLGLVAYTLRRGGKAVLFSGPLPTKFDDEAMAGIASAPPRSRDDLIDGLESTRRLSAPAPDLWLPSHPWHGQNANLYDGEWADLIATNFSVQHLQMNRASEPKSRGRSQ